LVVDEEEITTRDAADWAQAGLMTLAEAVTLKGMGRIKSISEALKNRRFTRLGTEATIGAAGAQLAGGATDIIDRMGEAPLELGEIASRRFDEGVAGAATGAALGGLVEGAAGAHDFVTGRTTGFLAPGPTERAGIDAVKKLNSELPAEGQILPTLGQLAESPDAMRFESIMGKMPFIGRLFREPLRQQDEALRSLQRKHIGGEPLTPLSDIGMEATETLRQHVNSASREAKDIETSLITRATDELDTALTRMAPALRPYTTEGAAALTKLATRSQYKAFQTKADELFKAAGDPIISTRSLGPELERIRGDLPKKTVINESQIIDVQGKPLATTEGRAIVNELVPEKLNRLMHGLDQLDPEMPLSELRRIRSMIDSAVVDGRGLPEVSTYELKQLQGAITRTIDDGVKGIGDDKVAKALTRANTFYREGIDRFEVPTIARLLKVDPNQPGFFRPYELLNTIQRDPDTYTEVERFMRDSVRESGQAVGSNSSRQFDILRRTITEEMFSRARVQPTSTAATLDADLVLQELKALKPKVRASLLGAEAKTIDRNLELLSTLKSGYKDVPEEALRNFLNRPNNSVQDLSRLATAVKRERESFQNGLLQKFIKGDVEAGALPEEKVVDWLLTHPKSTEVADVMAKLSDNPELTEKLRRRYLVGFLQKNRATPHTSEAALLDDASEILSPTKLIASLKDETQRNNLRTVLGDDSFNFIKNFTQAQALFGKAADSGAATVGGMAATGALLDIFRVLRQPTTVAKHLIFATVMTNKKLREAVMEQSLKKPLNTQEFTRALISSSPFVNAAAEDIGRTGVEFLMDAVSGDLGPKQEPQVQTR
jgi:hypothetical protein